LFPLFANGINNACGTGCKFSAGVVDTGGKLAPMSLILVVHLDLRISPQIFEKLKKLP
jgi:hypothetical protein